MGVDVGVACGWGEHVRAESIVFRRGDHAEIFSPGVLPLPTPRPNSQRPLTLDAMFCINELLIKATM